MSTPESIQTCESAEATNNLLGSVGENCKKYSHIK